MKYRSSSDTQQDQDAESSFHELHQQAKPLAFDSADSMLRQDAQQTTLPSEIRHRVFQSIDHPSKKATANPWWQKWMRL